MKKLLTAAVLALVSAPVVAQDQAEPSRYDRALAGGYKALMLCGAIANAERAGSVRSIESIVKYELTGIQVPLDGIVRDLPHAIERDAGGQVVSVTVDWSDDMPPRLALHDSQQGCSLRPIGGNPPPIQTMRKQVPQSGAAEVESFEKTPLAGSVAAAFAEGYGPGARTTAVVIMQNGSMIGERYADGFGPNVPQRTWSVAKSIAATLIGAATQRGEVQVSQRAGLGGTVSADRMRWGITIDDLLRMASGRYSDTPGNRTDPVYWGGTAVDERAGSWPVIHRPGTVYRYANNDTLMAIKAVQPTFVDHPPVEFFAKLGMHATVAETDWRGNYVLSSQVWSTARDLAKFGQLYLDDGVLPGGERILPENWRDYVSAPSGPQPDGGDLGYGAGFWLLNHSDGIPRDTFAGIGNRGQYVVIVPSMNIVIVRRGEDPLAGRFDMTAFTRDVLAALAE